MRPVKVIYKNQKDLVNPPEYLWVDTISDRCFSACAILVNKKGEISREEASKMLVIDDLWLEDNKPKTTTKTATKTTTKKTTTKSEVKQ